MYNRSMGKSIPNAFTLIELLVVISITAVIGMYALANYRSFGEDRNLKNAVLDVVSLLRQAQSNATTMTICNTDYDVVWQVVFSDVKTINLNCLEGATSFTKKILKLDANVQNISIQGVSGISCPNGVPFTINFAPLNGNIDFIGYSGCTLFTITLTNNKSTKSLNAEKGGRIYAQ